MKPTITPALKKRLMFAIPLLTLFYFANKFSALVRLSAGEGIRKLANALTDMSGLLDSPLPSFNGIDLLVGLACAGAIFAMVQSKSKRAKKFRQDVEYGSARWGTPVDIKPFTDKDPQKNVILTQTEGLMMGSRPKNPKYARNKNVLVIGGSGSGSNPIACNSQMGCGICRPD